MPASSLAAFWLVSMLLVLTPGADWAYAIATGLHHRRLLPAICGLLAGPLLATVVVAAGLAVLLAGAPAVVTGLTAAGALYLGWLGVRMLRHPAGVRALPGDAVGSSWQQLLKGFGVSGLNPKVFLFFFALLPQFVVTTAIWPVAVQIGVLGLTHIANCAVVYTGVGLGARRVLRSRPAVAVWVSRISGVAMIVIGAVLVTERLIGW